MARLNGAIAWARARVIALEELPVSPTGWALGFLSIVAVRHLLEIRSSQYPIYPPSAFYAHYLLAYLAPLLALSLVLSWFARVPIDRVLRLMLLAWGLTLLPPVLDALLARSHEPRIGYLDLGETPWTTLLVRFFDPTRPLQGTTPGIRIEAALACLLGAIYCGLRAPSQRAMRAAGAVGAIYVTSLGFFTLPVLFVRLLRPLMPGLTIQTLFGLAGRVGRPVDPTERADQAVLLYLVPLTLVLAGVALGRANRSLLARVGSALLGSHGPGWAMLALAGGLSGWSILEGVPAPASASPFDPLALCAVPVAALLAGAGVMLLAAPAAGAPGRLPVPDGMVRADPGPVRGDAATGTALLACAWVLAAAASVPSAACLAMALGAATLGRGSASLLPRAIGAPQLAAGVAALGAFLAGYAVTAGAEALVLLPAPLLAIVLASGFLADVPSMRRPRAVASNRAAAWLAAASAGAAPIMVLAGTAFAVGDAPGLVAALVAGAFAAGSLLFARVIDAPLLASLALTGAAAMVGLATTAPASLPAWREMALSSPTYYMRLSQNVEAAGDLERAAGAAAEAVRRAPGTASTHQRLGLVRARRGDMAGALEAFRKASSLSPEEGSIQVNLASALIQTGAPGEALERLDAAIARSTGTATALFNRARALDDLGRHAEAESAWREYLKLAQGRPEEASTVEFAHRRLAAGPGRPGPRGGH